MEAVLHIFGLVADPAILKGGGVLVRKENLAIYLQNLLLSLIKIRGG